MREYPLHIITGTSVLKLHAKFNKGELSPFSRVTVRPNTKLARKGIKTKGQNQRQCITVSVHLPENSVFTCNYQQQLLAYVLQHML